MKPGTESATATSGPPREPGERRVKRKFRRRVPDHAQSLRAAVQTVFLLLNVGIGIQFYLWVRAHEAGISPPTVSRPPGVEGWLPIASLMGLKSLLVTGDWPRVHPAGIVLLLVFTAVSLLFHKSFCSWFCPIGTLSEVLGRFGLRLLGRDLRLPRWIDVPLRGVKYLLLGLFAYAVAGMSVAGIHAFLESPYGIVADVKMLDFFRSPGSLTVGVLLGLAAASVVVRGFWCRFLCPYGALMGLVSLFSPTRIRRSADHCIDCGKCARACPSLIPVDHLTAVRSAECTSCLECVTACPVQDALALQTVGRRRVSPVEVAALICLIFLGFVAAARLTGHWKTHLSEDVYRQLVPRAAQFSHP